MMKKIKISLLAAILVLLQPCITQAQESTMDFENASSITAIAKNYVDALQKGDVATMNEQLSKDVMVHGLGGGLDSLNFTQHQEYFTQSMATYNQIISRDIYLAVKVTNNWNEGEWVLAWGTNTATNKKTDTKATIPYHIAFLVADGKISQAYYFYDILNIMTSQGYSLTEPKK